MNEVNVFEYKDYKAYLNKWITLKPKNGHGEKSKISNALGCHSAYLSQVLADKAELSHEQGYLFSHHASLNEEETEYFLLLIHYARAGNKEFKKYYLNQITKIEQKRSNLKNRLQYKKELSHEDRSFYFSEWYHSVIHLMVGTMKGYQTASELEKALNLPTAVIRKSLHFLESRGMIIKENNNYKLGDIDLYIGRDSSMITNHHTNFRLQAIRSLEHRREIDLHYSSVVTINQNDFEKIRKSLIESIEKVRKTVSESKNENVVTVFTIDLFPIVNSTFV